RRQTENFETRLAQARAERNRLQAERDRSDSEWTHKLETAAKDRDKRLEQELASFSLEREELKGKLAAAQLAVEQSVGRQQDLDSQLHIVMRDLDSARTAASTRSQEMGRAEFKLRAQFEASKEAAGFAQAALKEERLCREKLEQRLQTLTCESKEQTQQRQRLAAELS